MRKLLHWAFSVIGLLTICCVAALGEGYDLDSVVRYYNDTVYTDGDWEYRTVVSEAVGGTLRMYTAYNGTDTDIVLPDYAGAVAPGLFENNTSIRSFTANGIYNSPSGIFAYAFRGCTNLKEINISFSNSLGGPYIGQGAFADCPALEKVTLRYNFQLNSVRTYHSSYDIGEDAFSNCPSLNAARFIGASHLWSSLRIGSGNEALNELIDAEYDPDYTTSGSCGDSAKWYLKQMSDQEYVLILTGSGAVTSSPWTESRYWTSSNYSVVGLEIGKDITDVSQVLSSLTSIDGVAGDNYASNGYPLHWINTDEGVLHIFGSAGSIRNFASNHTTWVNPVYHAIVHEGVKYLGTDFFDSPLCATMTGVSLPGTLVEIAERGFKGTAIRTITLPENCTTLRVRLFEGCDSLKTIIVTGAMPQSVQDVFGYTTFSGTTATIRYPYDNGFTSSTLGGLTCRSYCRYSGGIVEHDLDYMEAISPTCTEDGNAEYWHCATCGTYFADENCTGIITAENVFVSATGHGYGAPAFTWAEDGSSCTATFTCDMCGDMLDAPAEVTGEMTLEPNCTDNGQTTYTATVSAPTDDTFTYTDTLILDDIPALGHEEVITIKAQEPTCTEDGCTAEIFCTRCETYVQESEALPATGHTDVVTLTALEPTCEQEGHTEEHTCSVCGTVLIASETLPALGHLWAAHVNTWAEDGSACTMALVCERDNETREFPATITSEIVEPATCTGMGTTRYTAVVDADGRTFTDELTLVDIDMIPHTIAVDPAVAPTDHDAGLTEGSHCAVCGEILSAQEEIPSIYNWSGTTITGYNGTDVEITLPADATALSATAFKGNNIITSVTIPENITSVGSMTFYNCASLEKVVIEGDVTGINGTTFMGATGVAIYAEADTEAARLLSFRGHSFITGDGWVVQYKVSGANAAATEVYIENKATDEAELTLPETLYGLPVTQLLANAFAGNDTCTRVIIPDSVTAIGSGAFADCLEQLTLCSSAENVAKTYAQENGLNWEEYPAKIEMDEPDMILPAGLTAIQEEAFLGVSASVIQLPEGVMAIGDRAFADCYSLRQMYIPASVTSIGEDVCRDCGTDMVIFGKKGTAAERFAAANGFGFVEKD